MTTKYRTSVDQRHIIVKRLDDGKELAFERSEFAYSDTNPRRLAIALAKNAPDHCWG